MAPIPIGVSRAVQKSGVDENHPLKIKVDYAELLNAALVLNRGKDTFDLLGVNLRLGSDNHRMEENLGYNRHELRVIERLARENLEILRNEWDKFCRGRASHP